tara:strand:- start:999 stop:2885 length:1887 start_codon:yes stop_codon:yes gene_type:complete
MRNRRKNHKFKLAFNTKKKASSIPETLYIFYRYGKFQKKTPSPFKVSMNDWDFNTQKLKSSASVKKVHESKREWINSFHENSENIAVQLHNDKITLDNAWAILLNTHTKGVVIETFIDNCISNSFPVSKRDKHYNRIITITNHLRRADFFKNKRDKNGDKIIELCYEHLQAPNTISEIEKVIIALLVKGATMNDYFETLNIICEVNPEISIKPFNKKQPEEETEMLDPLTIRDLKIAQANIGDQYQWLEAYLYFLFALSLRGLNGSDICMLNESFLEDENGSKDFKLLHYMPDYSNLVQELEWATETKVIKGVKHETLVKKKKSKVEKYDKKIYLAGKRSKSGKRIKILFNQFPTLVIYRLLKNCIRHNRPHLAYTGKDKIKLYNIDYRTSEGKKEWHQLRDTYSKQFKKISGGFTIGQTRHTFQAKLEDMGVDPKALSISLGHSVKKKTKDYYSNKISQPVMDIYHTEVLQRLDISGLIKLLFKGYGHKLLGITRYIDSGEMISSLPWLTKIDTEYKALDLPLSSWDFKKEEKLQALMKKEHNNIDLSYDDEGKPIVKEMDESNYSKELKALILEKKRILKDKYEEINIPRTDVRYETKNGRLELVHVEKKRETLKQILDKEDISIS